MFVFDAKSIVILKKVHPDLVKVMHAAIGRTPFAWRIVQGERTIEQQREYFKAGRSRVNPDAYKLPADLYRKAKHITGPGMEFSRAVDVCIVGKDPYNVANLRMLSEVVKTCAEELGVRIRWGGDFTTIRDMPHFEVVE